MINFKKVNPIFLGFALLNSVMAVPIFNCNTTEEKCCCSYENVSSDNCCDSDDFHQKSDSFSSCCTLSSNDAEKQQNFEIPFKIDLNIYANTSISLNQFSIICHKINAFSGPPRILTSKEYPLRI